MLSSVEQAFVGREEIRAPLKTPAWEAKLDTEGFFFTVRRSVIILKFRDVDANLNLQS